MDDTGAMRSVTIHGMDARAVTDQSAGQSPNSPATNMLNQSTRHVNGIGPVARVGWETFDGEGNASGTATTSVNGSILRSTFTATYTVNPYCTGTFAEQDSAIGPVNDDMAIVDGGREIQAITADPGGTVTAFWKKQFPQSVHDQ
jgi:hypothetical protein